MYLKNAIFSLPYILLKCFSQIVLKFWTRGPEKYIVTQFLIDMLPEYVCVCACVIYMYRISFAYSGVRGDGKRMCVYYGWYLE